MDNDIDTLLVVFSLFRHGDRAPLCLQTTDPTYDMYPNGVGELTDLGKRQAYQLGLYYKEHYAGFINPNYDHREIYVHSTDFDRTLMTAQCYLAGLFPAEGASKWMEDMPWQPIPVHTYKLAQDPLGIGTLDPEDGPTKEEMLRPFASYREMLEKWVSLLSWTNLGFFDSLIFSVDNIWLQKIHNLPYRLPTPETDFDADARVIWEVLHHCFKTLPNYQKQSVHIFKLVAEAFQGFLNGSKSVKMHLYSGHDGNIYAALNGLNKCPPTFHAGFCACLCFELHRREDRQLYVRFQMRKKLEGPTKTIPIVDDMEFCPLHTFLDLVQSLEQKVSNNIFKQF